MHELYLFWNFILLHFSVLLNLTLQFSRIKNLFLQIPDYIFSLKFAIVLSNFNGSGFTCKRSYKYLVLNSLDSTSFSFNVFCPLIRCASINISGVLSRRRSVTMPGPTRWCLIRVQLRPGRRAKLYTTSGRPCRSFNKISITRWVISYVFSFLHLPVSWCALCLLLFPFFSSSSYSSSSIFARPCDRWISICARQLNKQWT